MIAKDAAVTIGRALTSVKDICSQMIVVDTGSADNTASIAASLGVEIHYFKWINDFSAARNFALQFLYTDWIIVIDSDEELNKESFLKQVFLLDNPYCGGIKISITNFLHEGDDTLETIHKAVRIFRNISHIKYSGSVHEQVTPSILDSGLSIVDSEIQIFHYGYAEKSENRIARNRKMLLEELKQHPNDDWLKYHLAETEFASGIFESAEVLFLSVMNSSQLDITHQEIAQIKLGQIYLKNDKIKSALKALGFSSRDNDREGLRLFIMAALKALQGNYSDALSLYNNPLVLQSGMVGKGLLKKHTDDLAEILKNK
jgi:glycosyltransferase involved in cell wall biosynthesis